MKTGELISFETYLSDMTPVARQPVVWPWAALEDALRIAAGGERGTIALTSWADGGDHSVAPGISAAMQSVVRERPTSDHAHSFWHLYVVCSGNGWIETSANYKTNIAAGDVFFIPPWCDHSLGTSNEEPLLLLALQNLPAVADLGCLARRDGAAPIIIVNKAARPAT